MNKILVIDDDEPTQVLTVKALEHRGFTTLRASDGIEGLEAAKRHLPDLIICDVQMPRLNGYETLAALRQDPITATIPFIFLTGLTDRKELRQGMGLGADDFLTKPFSANELMQAVRTRLEKQAAVQRRSERKLEDLRGNIDMALPHELLTPLNGILGLASLLMEEDSTVEQREVQDFARKIHLSAQRLHHLIENFIIYSQAVLTSSDPKKTAELREAQPIPVADLIERITREKAELVGRQDDLALNLCDVEVRILPVHLRKGVEEIIDNALKFSKAGAPVRVTARIEDGQLVLAVHDQGRGMTPEQIADIGAHMQFERRFYEQQGVGLGLIIAKRVAELYGGQLTVQSIPGEGTVVRFIVPAAKLSG
jgi:signal transduction histidine kinase